MKNKTGLDEMGFPLVSAETRLAYKEGKYSGMIVGFAAGALMTLLLIGGTIYLIYEVICHGTIT